MWLSGILFKSGHLCMDWKWHSRKLAGKIKWVWKSSGMETGGGEGEGGSSLNVYGCSEAAAPAAGHTRPLFICLCKSSPKETRRFCLIFFLPSLPDIPACDISSLPHLNRCQTFIQSPSIFSPPPLCFSSITWRNLFLIAFICRGRKK